jgi:hypothetical protein
LIDASLGTHRFQRAGVDRSPVGSQERQERSIPINAPPAEPARWKRRVPRRLPIYAQDSSHYRLSAEFIPVSNFFDFIVNPNV